MQIFILTNFINSIGSNHSNFDKIKWFDQSEEPTNHLLSAKLEQHIGIFCTTKYSICTRKNLLIPRSTFLYLKKQEIHYIIINVWILTKKQSHVWKVFKSNEAYRYLNKWIFCTWEYPHVQEVSPNREATFFFCIFV